MDMLALRKSVGNLTGMVLVNGQPATPAFVRRTAYVPQQDNFVPTMTAGEVLGLYASLLLRLGAAGRRARCEEMLTVMGLAGGARTLVGGELAGGHMLRGLSGGERKRLAIACGVVAAPSAIFLDEVGRRRRLSGLRIGGGASADGILRSCHATDAHMGANAANPPNGSHNPHTLPPQPTSGLDSFAALSVMGYLQRLARDKGHVVLASIHQVGRAHADRMARAAAGPPAGGWGRVRAAGRWGEARRACCERSLLMTSRLRRRHTQSRDDAPPRRSPAARSG
jgi:ABC-type lipoprotein export system ATPase subunit